MTVQLPITAIVVTKNEEQRIGRCLEHLKDFSEIIVVDSCSHDRTAELAKSHGADLIDFNWNGAYPKKRQWCLDHLKIKNDLVFFIDADEIVTGALIEALRSTNLDECAGYFITGRYIWGDKALKFGLRNNKLALLNRHKFVFPVIDDLDAPGMGEIEGHYQPILKPAYAREKIGSIKTPLDHYACESPESWEERHKRYAAWERHMNAHTLWPADPSPFRQNLKRLFRAMPMRPLAAFLHSYLLKGGLLDGKAGLSFALSRYRYYRMIKNGAAISGAPSSKAPETAFVYASSKTETRTAPH